MRTLLPSVIVMLMLFTACDRTASSTSATTAPTGATAEVSAYKATFIIPVEPRSIWRWHLASTPFNAFEYDWSISQGVRSFGFSVWKNGNAPPKEGDLSQLVEAGQGSIWEPTLEGGRLIGKIAVTSVRQGSALEMVLLEQTILKELLEKRPPTLEVVTRTLDTTKPQYSIAEKRYSIPVNYR